MIDNQLISIALFAGAFGLDLGIEEAGFYTISVVEIDADATKTIVLNRPYLSESAVPRDIRQVSAQILLEEGGRVLKLGRPLLPGEVDLITGGPPCQPFSTAGKRGSVIDPRGSLFMDFIRIVKEIQPRFFLMENVKGLLSSPIRHRPHNKRGAGYPPLEADEMEGAALQAVLAEMKAIGYKVTHSLVEAADYGVPQTRARVIFIGSQKSEIISLFKPTHNRNGLKGVPIWLTLRDALANLSDPQPEYVPYSKQRLKYISLLKEGQNWRHLPDELKPEAMGGAYKSGGGKVGFYRRLSWVKPSPTVTASPHQKATDMCHPVELRPLSIREYARIQTFPDNWVFYGSVASRYRQIGNSVPVKLAYAIGKYLYKLIKDEKPQSTNIYEQLSFFDFEPFKNLIELKQGEDRVSEQFHEMLAYALKNEVDFTPKKARSLASYFADVTDFLEAKEENIKNLKSISGKNVLKLTDEEITKLYIYKKSGYLSAELTVAENYLAVISRVFTQKQLDMVRSLSLKHLNPNPFLIRALNLDTPDEVVRLNVYMAATRSIVTSMGFFIEDLLVTSSDTVEKAPKKSGWDLVKTSCDGEKFWLQIKSGPNNMDKDQVVYWAEKIQDKVKEGDKAYIGFTYGKRTSRTVTIGLLKQILPDWQMQTLIGKELWNFLSEDPDYSSKLFEVLRKSAHQILHQNSLSEEIDSCATRVTDEFIQEFGDGVQGVSNYINSIF